MTNGELEALLRESSHHQKLSFKLFATCNTKKHFYKIQKTFGSFDVVTLLEENDCEWCSDYHLAPAKTALSEEVISRYKTGFKKFTGPVAILSFWLLGGLVDNQEWLWKWKKMMSPTKIRILIFAGLYSSLLYLMELNCWLSWCHLLACKLSSLYRY